MTEDEIQRMLRGIPDKNSRFTFRLGDTVRIKSGPFASFTGKVEGINQAISSQSPGEHFRTCGACEVKIFGCRKGP